MNRLRTDLDDDMSFERLAEVACFSPFHFHRIYRGMTGETIADTVRRMRLLQAATALTTSERAVIDIAVEAGFDSGRGFTRAFSAFAGMTPSGYRSRHARIDRAIREGDPMEVEIRELPARRVLAMRKLGPYPQVPQVWDALWLWMRQRGLIGRIESCIGLPYDDSEQVPGDRIRYDACVGLIPGLEPPLPDDEVRWLDIEGGPYAVYRHVGPCSLISEAFGRLYGLWLPQSGITLRAAPPLEIYINDRWTTPPDRRMTELALPIEA
ncbi:MAG TPA: AraC family transcriptional regulator [Aliidongia sp.]|uniref:AraC family transcriptional regulator n=1 Tax=Aliidongia sp. TaxID=1914230 RepID=UPI002DDD9157|nr:AraC family transcriptional regulator [Aliidongia sp.]HEV2676669.1 AraC family transcriptional regulator [Aliidongia sp.]